MSTVRFREAIRLALDQELDHDDRVLFFGEDIAAAGGVFATSPGLATKHGHDRVFDTPISELALAGAAFGAAACGLRPIIEIMFGDFLGLAMDSLVNQAAKYWFLSNEQKSIPLVVRSAIGGGGRFGAIHSQVPVPWFYDVPGLKIVAPASVWDAWQLLKASVRDENPVLFLEHKRLYSLAEDVSGLDARTPVERLGSASVVREGRDVTLVSTMRGVHDCLHAADLLSQAGVSAEVIDVRTIRPLDHATVLTSLGKTSRVIAVDEGPRGGGWAADLLARIAEEALSEVDSMCRITTPTHPIPYSPVLEDEFFPTGETIAAKARDILG